MILHGNQRSGGSDLARHLLNEENTYIEVLELRGFASDDLESAFQEIECISRATRCKQYLYSLSLSSPPEQEVSTEDFRNAAERVEAKLGLSGQKRALVLHGKNGRLHAHAVWSRIDEQEFKAINLPHTKLKLRDISRSLFIEHGWEVPRGLIDYRERNISNFTLAQWQQAKRQGKDPRAIKSDFQNAWAQSDSKTAFTHALQECGYHLARGTRRGFVAIDIHGEIYSVPKWVGVKTKEVRQRLGNEAELRPIDEVKDSIARETLPKLKEFLDQIDQRQRRQKHEFNTQRSKLTDRQSLERATLNQRIHQRQQQEAIQRQARFNRGLKGLWDRVRGEHGRIQKRNEHEALACFTRDRKEKDTLIFRHLEQQKRLDHFRVRQDKGFDIQRREIFKDVERYEALQQDLRPDVITREREHTQKVDPSIEMEPD